MEMKTKLELTEAVTRLHYRRCSVCQDEYDGGLHYGAHACVCCKAFFRRTVRQGVEYDCVSDGNCAIEGELRVSCRACRFDQCLAVGMQREAVRPVRGPIKRIKKRGRKWPARSPVKLECDGNLIGSPAAGESSSCQSYEMHSDHMEFLMEPSHQFSATAFIQDIATICNTNTEFSNHLPQNNFSYYEMELLLSDICGSDSETINQEAGSPELRRDRSVSLAIEDLQFSEEFERQMMEWLSFSSSD